MTIEQLAIKYGSDKRSEIHNFTRWYELYFDGYAPKKLLEIGVFGGASVKMWYDYFPKSQIIGVDIDPELIKYQNNRTKIYIGDQADKKFLEYLIDREQRFDVVIDDGGHTSLQQITSFENLFPSVSPGGLYIIEDLHTSYWKEWQNDSTVTTIEYLQKIINRLQWFGLNGYGDPFSKASKEDKDGYGLDKAKAWMSETGVSLDIEWMHFYKSIVFIKKRDNEI